MPSTEVKSQATNSQKKPSDHSSGDKRFKVLDITMKRNQYRQDALIEVLHKAQEAFGYLEEVHCQ